jgi:hypothetical protein
MDFIQEQEMLILERRLRVLKSKHSLFGKYKYLIQDENYTDVDSIKNLIKSLVKLQKEKVTNA